MLCVSLSTPPLSLLVDGLGTAPRYAAPSMRPGGLATPWPMNHLAFAGLKILAWCWSSQARLGCACMASSFGFEYATGPHSRRRTAPLIFRSAPSHLMEEGGVEPPMTLSRAVAYPVDHGRLDVDGRRLPCSPPLRSSTSRAVSPESQRAARVGFACPSGGIKPPWRPGVGKAVPGPAMRSEDLPCLLHRHPSSRRDLCCYRYTRPMYVPTYPRPRRLCPRPEVDACEGRG